MNDKARQHVMEWLRETEKNLQAFYRLLNIDRAKIIEGIEHGGTQTPRNLP